VVQEREWRSPSKIAFATKLSLLLAASLAARCGGAGPKLSQPESTSVLRVGIGGLPNQSADRGVGQFISFVSNEGLLRVNQAGKVGPWLVDSWQTSADGLTTTLRLRPRVTFHDGSPLDAATVVKLLRDTLPKTLGPVFEDVESISSASESEVEVRFKRPSPFVLESFIDIFIQKPGPVPVGVGPFMAKSAGTDGGSPNIVAFSQYDLGPPKIQQLDVKTYPNTRAAWADLLRDRLDFLYEVGTDALTSMTGTSTASLYTFDRPFQYMVILNARNPKLRAPEVRRALNQAVDRAAIARDGLGGHGTPSVGPVSAHNWAFKAAGATYAYAPQAAAAALTTHTPGKATSQQASRLSFTCLTPSDPPYDRLALVVKQQLKAVGVDMTINEVTPNDLVPALGRPETEAVLVDAASGWGLFRAYRWWHSKGTQNLAHFSSASVDTALDRIRHAANDDEYRRGVELFQQAISDDPPAIFLVWSERSRAVSKRFDVQPEPGRDVLATLRLWRPTADKGTASQN
jgi:peptide/nickel transport system substrate-binding protein